jgi:hypothetical protein
MYFIFSTEIELFVITNPGIFLYLSYLGTFHKNEEMEMSVHEWLRRQ